MTIAPSMVQGRKDQILEESIGQHVPATLTHRTPEGWRTHKCSFHAGSRQSALLTVVVPSVPEQAAVAMPVIGETLGLTFRRGHKKCMCSAVLQAVEPAPDQALLTLRWPDHLQQLQRRVFERALPPRGVVIAVRFWPAGEEANPAGLDRVVRHGQLEDLSAGGMRIKVSDAKEIVIGAAYRCVFAPRVGAPAFVIDATLRHREAQEEGRASLGWQFIGLETTPDGRRALDRLSRVVSQFHRAKIRQRRP